MLGRGSDEERGRASLGMCVQVAFNVIIIVNTGSIISYNYDIFR